MKIFDIKERGILFKNLISGPAPVGRILNYIYLCGVGKLRHKNGHRYTNLNDDIGYAWTTELMIGLGFIELGSSLGDTQLLYLTPKGKEIFNIINANKVDFCEGVRPSDLQKLRMEVNSCSPILYDKFKSSFIESLPFQILKEYLNENGYYYSDRKRFIDDYFECIMDIYDENPAPYNRQARTTTGENRVPSILQLCMFFDFMRQGSDLSFDVVAISKTSTAISNKAFSKEELLAEAEEEEALLNQIIEEDIFLKYGVDGNVLRTTLVRNSTLQAKFKHNLIVKNKCKCMMCDVKTKTVLRGSHIKPAHLSNAFEKVDDNNGLLLCANHDALFDQYLITFDFIDGKIKISDSLLGDEQEMENLGLSPTFALDPALLTDERLNYLMEHNLEFQHQETERNEDNNS